MSARHVGMTLLSLAKRVCDEATVDSVALPIIADIQFEARAHSHRPAVFRWWLLASDYAAFFKAIALTVLLGEGRNPMHSKAVGWLRLLVAIPLALLVSGGVQRAAGYVFGRIFVHPGPRLPNGVVLAEGIWLVKILSSPFMAAALFWTMYLVAPPERRSAVAIGGLIVSALWGCLMVFGSFERWPDVHVSLFAMGLALWLGGGVSYWIARRFRVGLAEA